MHSQPNSLLLLVLHNNGFLHANEIQAEHSGQLNTNFGRFPQSSSQCSAFCFQCERAMYVDDCLS